MSFRNPAVKEAQMSEERDSYAAIGALADPVRRRLYEYVVSATEPVSREQAARGADVPAHSARFHLDRLVDEGLLEVGRQRLSGRTGPGAGRPAKVYRRSSAEVAVSLPSRGYDLVGRVLAAAVERSLAGASLDGALTDEARRAGQQDGEAGSATGDELSRMSAVLADRGFEPSRTDGGLVLRNCPFDALARAHTALVCGVNRDYVGGVVDGLGCRETVAELDPAPDRCCVRVSRRPAAR